MNFHRLLKRPAHFCQNSLLSSTYAEEKHPSRRPGGKQLSKHPPTEQATHVTGLLFLTQTPHRPDLLTLDHVASLMIHPYTPLDTLNKHR